MARLSRVRKVNKMGSTRANAVFSSGPFFFTPAVKSPSPRTKFPDFVWRSNAQNPLSYSPHSLRPETECQPDTLLHTEFSAHIYIFSFWGLFRGMCFQQGRATSIFNGGAGGSADHGVTFGQTSTRAALPRSNRRFAVPVSCQAAALAS